MKPAATIPPSGARTWPDSGEAVRSSIPQGDGATLSARQFQVVPTASGGAEAIYEPAFGHGGAKRLLDVVLSASVLLAGAPVWVLLALVVKVTSAGPIIYRQRRIGYLGRTFVIYKFRTMRDGAEVHTGPVWAQADDPRYTRIGRWLRKWRLDEAPQFWNVLLGDMSLVGPRPERPYFVDRLAVEIPGYHRRHHVKPGITGWAQVNLKYDASVEDVRTKIVFDLFYIEHASLSLDAAILWRTFRTLLSGKGR